MSSKSVLIVDDYSDLLTLLGSALNLLGWDTSLANSGEEAWKQLQRNSPRIILLDMWMAGMNGFEFAKVLKKHPVYRNIPILGTSACAISKEEECSFRNYCDDFLSKPFAISSLQQRLTSLLAVTEQQNIAKAPKPTKT